MANNKKIVGNVLLVLNLLSQWMELTKVIQDILKRVQGGEEITKEEIEQGSKDVDAAKARWDTFAKGRKE